MKLKNRKSFGKLWQQHTGYGTSTTPACDWTVKLPKKYTTFTDAYTYAKLVIKDEVLVEMLKADNLIYKTHHTPFVYPKFHPILAVKNFCKGFNEYGTYFHKYRCWKQKVSFEYRGYWNFKTPLFVCFYFVIFRKKIRPLF